jgi:hypothetical protein
VKAFISCAHRGFQLLIDATTGHVGESKRFSVRKNGADDGNRTPKLQLGMPNAVNRLDELRTNRDGSIEFVDPVSSVRGLCKLNS